MQELQRNSGLPLMKYLQEKGLSYSTYNNWKRKFLCQESEESEIPFAQVCLRPSTEVAFLLLQVTSPYVFLTVFMYALMREWKKVLPDKSLLTLTAMFCLNDTMRYFLCPGRTDMRKGISSLCGA